LSIGEVGSQICIFHRPETRCCGDVAHPGRVSSERKGLDLCCFGQNFRGNGKLEFSDGRLNRLN
jgi:hypothetical protein